MQALTNRVKQVDRRKMNFLEKLYLSLFLKVCSLRSAIFLKRNQPLIILKKQGLSVRFFVGLHILNRDEEGRENCTACGLCAVACPAEAITMEAAERQTGEENLYREEKYAAKYEINMLRCIFCGLCEEACPKDAIYLSETFAPANYQRKEFIYGKEDLLIPHPIEEPEAYKKALGNRAKKETVN